MRELYLVACGLVLGVTLRDWLDAHERRVAYRAADIAEETLAMRRRFREENPQPVEPTPAAEPTPA